MSATPGPWSIKPNGRGGFDVWAGRGTDEVCVAQAMTRADAEHIAGAHTEWTHLLRWLTDAHSSTIARAESAEAEVVTLRAKVAAVEGVLPKHEAAVVAARRAGEVEFPVAVGSLCEQIRAALATTGEGQ